MNVPAGCARFAATGRNDGLNRRSFLCRAGGTLAVLASCATASARTASNPVDAIDLDGAPGLALAVIERGRTVLLAGKGRRGPNDAIPPNGDTLFEIGSLTKTFTAGLIFELEAEGRLDTAAPIGRYVTGLPTAWQPLRLDSLLSHTSGLPEYLDAGNFREIMARDAAPRTLIERVATKPLAFPPGARHAYNNTGFVLLGLAAEAAADQGYWDQLSARFFRPAGMTRTGPRGRIAAGSNVAHGSFWDGAAWDHAPPRTQPGSTFSAGGLLSTARDLARWAEALDRGQGLSAHARRRMWRPARLHDGSPAGWGYGWIVEGQSVAHGGGTAGFSCWLRRDLAADLTTIILTNQNGRADPLAMTRQLLNALPFRRRR